MFCSKEVEFIIQARNFSG